MAKPNNRLKSMAEQSSFRGMVNRDAIPELMDKPLAIPDSIDLDPQRVPEAGRELFAFLDAHGAPPFGQGMEKESSRREIDVSAVLSAEKRMPAEISSQNGFLAIDDSIPLIDPRHRTALDAAKYISSKMTEGVTRLIKGGSKVELHAGSYTDTIRDLKERGYGTMYQIRPERGPLDLLLAVRDSGEYTFAIANLYNGRQVSWERSAKGEEQVTKEKKIVGDAMVHYQANIMKLIPGQDNDERLKNAKKQVRIVDHHRDYREIVRGAISQVNALDGSRHGPETFVIGGRIIAKDLYERWRVAKDFQNVVDYAARKALTKTDQLDKALSRHIGREPTSRVASALTVLEGEDVVKLFERAAGQRGKGPNQEVFRDRSLARTAKKLIDSLKDIKHLSGLDLPDFEEGKDPKTKIQNDALPIRNLVYKSSEGKKNLTYSAIPYGNLTGDVYDALTELGTKDIVFIGTAGTLAGKGGDIPVGSVVLPVNTGDIDDRWVEGKKPVDHYLNDHPYEDINPATADFVTGDYRDWVQRTGGRIDLKDESDNKELWGESIAVVPGNHISLQSALQEGPEMVEQMRDNRYDTVDIEGSKLRHAALANVEGPTPSIVLLVSDEPGSRGETINALSPEVMRVGRQITLDWLIKKLDIKDIEKPAI